MPRFVRCETYQNDALAEIEAGPRISDKCLMNVIWLVLSLVSSPAFSMPVAPLRDDVVSSEAEPAVLRPTDSANVINVFDENAGKETSTKPVPDAPGINIDRKKADFYGADFDNVIVINKARDVQTMTVYRYQQLSDGRRKMNEVRKFKVSTGQEVWRCQHVLDKDRHKTGKLEARWLGTPTGFYVPSLCEAVHTSNTYDDAKMRNACFFNAHLGIAIHKPDVREIAPLPPRRSGQSSRSKSDGIGSITSIELQSGRRRGVGAERFPRMRARGRGRSNSAMDH